MAIAGGGSRGGVPLDGESGSGAASGSGVGGLDDVPWRDLLLPRHRQQLPPGSNLKRSQLSPSFSNPSCGHVVWR